MIIFPNCKINLGLNVLSRRKDGYYELQSIFYPLLFTDVLEVLQKNIKDEGSNNPELSVSGIAIETSSDNNLCIKAYQLLKNDFPDLPAVQMHLHKNIPTGAGLGGGSADGAFTLKLLNQKFQLGLNNSQMLQYALQLGSNCPFFIINKPCFGTGRGEILETVDLDLAAYQIVLVHPGIHCSTAHAFSQIQPRMPVKSIKEIIRQPVVCWKNELQNDFEELVFKEYPELRSIKEKLYECGADYASLTGSGSTVYGLFKKTMEPRFHFPENYFVKILSG